LVIEPLGHRFGRRARIEGRELGRNQVSWRLLSAKVEPSRFSSAK
jgi:hypothetical protein